MQNIVTVTCKFCHGGENGEKAACLIDIKLIVEDGDIAYMLYSEHVKEKLEPLGYDIIYQYPEGNIKHPIGMWIMKASKQMPVNTDKLPEFCYATLPTTKETIIIKRYEKGHWKSKDQRPSSVLNKILGVTRAQEEAMLSGSVFGFNVPAADPDNYNEDGSPKK